MKNNNTLNQEANSLEFDHSIKEYKNSVDDIQKTNNLIN